MSTLKPLKPTFNTDFQEFEAADFDTDLNNRTSRTIESIRLGLTLLALLSAITVLGAAGDSLAVFNQTSLSSAYQISMWPLDFNIRPTVALVTCGAIVLVASTISLVTSKVSSLRNRPLVHSAVAFLAPTVCLIAGLIGTSYFYGVNTSDTTHSLQSWSCQWSSVQMNIKPHWGTLCRESKVALYLTVMMIPIQVLVLATAAWGAIAEKKQLVVRERKNSPAMS